MYASFAIVVTNICFVLQISQLTGDVARLTSQLEKGEVFRQNLEYELAKANKVLAAEKQKVASTEAEMFRNVAELKSKQLPIKLFY